MPESVTDRLTKSYEYIFFFTKSKKYHFNLDNLRIPNLVVGVTDMRPPGILRQRLYEGSQYNDSDDPHLAQFKAKEKSPIIGGLTSGQREGSPKHLIASKYPHQSPKGKNPGDVWTMTTQPYTEAHFACFTPELPERCIKAGCPEGGIVLDPFAGSGTTLQVAKELGMEGIGIDINPEYVEIIKKRLHARELLNREEFKVVVL